MNLFLVDCHEINGTALKIGNALTAITRSNITDFFSFFVGKSGGAATMMNSRDAQPFLVRAAT
jgi:hypothetical protein